MIWSITGEWAVGLDESNSDHRYIRFSIATKQPKETKQVRLTKNTDWEKFDEILSRSQELRDLDSNVIRTTN